MEITYQIAVPEPCSEDWESMRPVGCARFCAACTKAVVDFTAFSDEAFIAYFRENGMDTCGRFAPHQFALEIPWLDTGNKEKSVANPLYKTLQYAALSLLPLAAPATDAFSQKQAQEVVGVAPSTIYPVMVNGILLDENGEPLPGGSVLLKGTKEGTATDMDGYFAIQLRNGMDTLEFRSPGWETRLLKIENPGIPLTIQLNATADRELGEIFISGIPIRHNSNTGIAIEKRPVTDITKALANAAPNCGQFVTGGRQLVPSIRIPDRQYKAPLIVLNGKRFEGNVTDIDPMQIKTLKVLKDAAATALYGAAGRDGVLLVETKDASFWYRITKPFRKRHK